MTLILSQCRTGRVQCRVALALFQSHGLFFAMRQSELPQYLLINLPPPCCVSLVESEHSEDPSHMGMSGLSAENSGNLLGKLVLWNLRYRGCEEISRF